MPATLARTRRVTCRMLDDQLDRCTAEAWDADADPEIQMCPHHLALVLELFAQHGLFDPDVRIQAVPRPPTAAYQPLTRDHHRSTARLALVPALVPGS